MSNIRTTVRVTCHEGTTWATTINGTLADAKGYFLGRIFTEEDCETGKERPMRVVEVVELPEDPKPATPAGEAAPARVCLDAVSTDDLIREIYRRHQAGDCVALVITPDDLAEYWECDDAGNTHPGSRVPETGNELTALRRAFDRWLDTGGHSEIMQVLCDAWQDEQARQLDGEKGGDR